MSDDDVRISFSAKELLERMDGRLDDITKRLTDLEFDRANKTRMKREWRELLVATATVIASVASAVGIVQAVHG